MSDLTEDLLRKFDFKPSSPVKTANNINLSYRMADDSLIDLKDYAFRQRRSINDPDNDYTPSPVKRERPEIKQAVPFSTTTRLSPVLPNRLFASPTKNYSQHVIQERSGPSSPQKKVLQNENEEVKSLRLEMKRLKQEYNLKLENLNYKLNSTVKERDEMDKENFQLSNEKSRLQAYNDLLKSGNEKSLKEKFDMETQLKNKDMEILSLKKSVLKAVDMNKIISDENMTLKQSFEKIQVKLKKYFDLYKECQRKHYINATVASKEQEGTADDQNAPEKENDVIKLQPQNEPLIQAINSLTKVIEQHNGQSNNELRDLVMIIKDLVNKIKLREESPIPQMRPISLSTPPPSSVLVSQETVQSNLQSQPSDVYSNSQPAQRVDSGTTIPSHDIVSPNVRNTEEPHDIHIADQVQLQRKEKNHVGEVQKESTTQLSRSDIEEMKELLRVLVNGANNNTNNQGSSQELPKESESKENVNERFCCCGIVANHPVVCPVCLNKEDFTVSRFLGK